MDLKRHRFLLIWTSVLVVTASVCLFFLIQKRGGFKVQKQALLDAETTLQRLRSYDPYPSEENVQVLEENLKKVEAFRKSLLENLHEGQIKPLDVEPAQFPLEAAFTRLNRLARDRTVRVSENSVYGFDEYVGAIPKREHLERLTIQLQVVEKVCAVLFECHIEELLSVERQSFEVKKVEEPVERVPRRGRRRRAKPKLPVNQTVAQPADAAKESLLDVEKVVLSFEAKPDALWCLLNQFAKTDMFTIVKSVHMASLSATELEQAVFSAKPKSEEEEADPSGESKITLQEMTSHEERLVVGRDPIAVTLIVDVLQFQRDQEHVDRVEVKEVKAGGRR